MRSAARRVAGWCAVACFVIAGGLAAGGIIAWETHRAEVAQLIDNSDPVDRYPPQVVRELLVILYQGHTAAAAARLAIGELEPAAAKRPSVWTIRWSMWTALMATRFSEEQRLALIASRIWTGMSRRGLNSASRELFGRPMDELNRTQAAELIALVKQPALRRYPERWTAVRDRLLAQADAQH